MLAGKLHTPAPRQWLCLVQVPVVDRYVLNAEPLLIVVAFALLSAFYGIERVISVDSIILDKNV